METDRGSVGEDRFLYFAYGSNLSSKRLRARTPSARFVTVASLSGHDLRWHKRSTDGSGKCDAFRTGRAEDVVVGVIWEILESERAALDRVEGRGSGYDAAEVTVESVVGPIVAWTYRATDIDPELLPYDWYKEHVLAGAREHGLPAGTVRRIEEQPFVPDLRGER